MDRTADAHPRMFRLRGDTVAQRKQQACQLLSSMGLPAPRGLVRQERGTLYVFFDPPFPEELLLKLDRLARYAAVTCVPHGELPEMERVVAVFEREPGWHFAVPVLSTNHPIASRRELATLLPWYNQLMRQRATLLANAASQGQEGHLIEAVPLGLWGENHEGDEV
jgi:hypothetical protein